MTLSLSPLRLRRTLAAMLLCAMATSGVTVFAQESSSSPPHSSHSSVKGFISRVASRFNLPDEDASNALEVKQRLLQTRVAVRFRDEQSDRSSEDITLALADHPDWIVFNTAKQTFMPNERSIRYFLEESDAIPRVQRAVATPDGSGSVSIQGTSKGGFSINSFDAAKQIVAAFSHGDTYVIIDSKYQEPTLMLMSNKGVTELPMISRGMSDFAKSPAGRESNIRRALSVYLNGTVIPRGSNFSLNTALANSHGWSPALIIGPGGKLVNEPGGGICQAASTMFRAALLAGLPIVKRANHSLYVGYYEEYGVGLDATVYPGKQDLTFKNDTDSSIIVAARSNGTQAVVEFYGKPDGRTVSLEGPFFSTSNDGFDQKLSIKQIAWNYGVTYPDGNSIEKPIVSTYTMLPKLIRTKYAEAQGKRLLSELAPNPMEGVVGMR